MRAQAHFREILERKLAAAGEAGRPPDRRPLTRPLPPPLFAFASGSHSFRTDAARPAACGAYGVRRPVAPVSPPRRPLGLSPSERHAADELRRLGAAFPDDDFSVADVRSAYRALARRFHPDAHPGATEAERSYLAGAFGRITTAYHELTRAR
jgi:hypothetical protein